MSCMICSSVALKPWAMVGPWSYEVCQRCATVQLRQVPTRSELAEYYNSVFRVNREIQEKKIAKSAGTCLDLLARHVPKPGKLLDIGSSYGGFMEQARAVGWDVEGVEVSLEAANCARRERSLRIHVGDLQEVICELTPPYDAVVMFHVIEHSPQPHELLRTAASLLRPGGLLCLRTPNAQSWLARVCGKTWEWLIPPAHIVLFSPTSLSLCLQFSGFRVLDLRTQRGDASNPLYEISRAVNKRLRRPISNPLRRSAPGRRSRFYPCIRFVERVSDLCYASVEPMENVCFAPRLLMPEIIVVSAKPPQTCQGQITSRAQTIKASAESIGD